MRGCGDHAPAGGVENRFLDSVCRKLKTHRQPDRQELTYAIRQERVNGRMFASLWFRTRGCRRGQHGGCTVCNYGHARPPSATEMVNSVREGLLGLNQDETAALLVSPSGSMFDEWEVPNGARKGILSLIRETPCRSFTCETRADTVTDDRVREYASFLGNKAASVEIGLESASAWVLKYCLNKSLKPGSYLKAIRLLRKHGIRSIANIMLGSPFLSPRESIDDAVFSVVWALSNGTDECVLFPVHVKRWTLAEWLWRRGLYSPPSLWSLVEVLWRLGPQRTRRVTISWYRPYRQRTARSELDLARDLALVLSPNTCDNCVAEVINMLDAFRCGGGFAVVERLRALDCSCKARWQASLESRPLAGLEERVRLAYDVIGREILGEAR